MQWRKEIYHALQLRNSRAHRVTSLLDEINRLKSEFVAATVARKALERQAVVTVLASGHGDISGLLADTPLPFHLCGQLAVEVQNLLANVSEFDETCDIIESETITMRDPVFRSATERIVEKFLLSASRKFAVDDHNDDGNPELAVATLENEFAGLVCEALLAARGINGDDFDLSRMLRMLTAFRSLVADACYGGMTRQAATGVLHKAEHDGLPAMMDPVEIVAARKARLAVTHEVGSAFLF